MIEHRPGWLALPAIIYELQFTILGNLRISADDILDISK